MSNESIFHRIVTSENSYTQLLCNTLKREPSLLGDLLGLADIKLRDPIKPEDIRPQVGLNECGQVDLLIRSDTLTVIFEVKIHPHRPLEESQKLDGKRPGYKEWLEREKAEGHDAWLVYLVPGNWEYRQDNNKEIERYKRSSGQRAINVRQIYWDNVLQLLLESNSRARSSFVEEFQLLLTERFRPINFTSKEAEFMFTPEFPMATLVKLNGVLEGLRTRVAMNETESASESYEFGFYLKAKDGGKLFVGLSMDFWNAGHKYPICFGVPDEDVRVKAAFSQAFQKVYKQEPISIANMGWTMGWVPQEEFNRFEKNNAIDAIWEKLEPIWDSVKKAK
jgi:hypothetical protein